MNYLVILGSRVGDVVLDPFIGSGTTAVACLLNNRKYVGIELNNKYYEIVKLRLKSVINQGNMCDFINYEL